MNEPDDTFSLDQVFRALQRRRFLLVQCVVAGAVAGLLIASLSDERYEASATVLVGAAPGATETPGQLNAEAAARLVRTRGVAERVAQDLAGAASPGALLDAVSARPDDSGAFVTVTASDPSPARAAEIANGFANQFIAARTQTVGIEAEVIDPAVGGQLQRDFEPVPWTITGAALGLLLGLVLALALSALDPRVRSLREIAQLLPVPQLAAVAAPAGRRRRRRTAPALAVDPEPFQHLRSALLVFRGERSLERLVVTSPSDHSEGKTPVAASLALALARMGLRVCVVDADTRSAQLASQFGIDATGGSLVDVLRGAPAEKASYRFRIPGEGSGNGATPLAGAELTIVPGATASIDAADLLAGPRLGQVLGELGRQYDVVIVDAPPVLTAAETLQLAEGASGTILVIRHSHTARRAAVRAARVVTEARGTILGVVATGVPRSEVGAEGSGPWPASAGIPTHAG